MSLFTSLYEIRSFQPCPLGWKSLLSAHPHENKADMNRQFPLIDCLESNSISDVCWLIGRRRVEIQICVRFARMCADSVAGLDNKYAGFAFNYADYAKAVYEPGRACHASADAATETANAASYAAGGANAAYNKQVALNKTFLTQCINEFTLPPSPKF